MQIRDVGGCITLIVGGGVRDEGSVGKHPSREMAREPRELSQRMLSPEPESGVSRHQAPTFIAITNAKTESLTVLI